MKIRKEIEIVPVHIAFLIPAGRPKMIRSPKKIDGMLNRHPPSPFAPPSLLPKTSMTTTIGYTVPMALRSLASRCLSSAD
jgi:hypothetical protein